MTDDTTSSPASVLLLSAPDRPGLVAAVSSALFAHECNIEESAQFNDHLSGKFFMRVLFTPLTPGAYDAFMREFTQIAARYDMNWQAHHYSAPVKTVIMVSQWDHCLYDLLYRWRTGHLNIDITAIISNHENSRPLAAAHKLPFHYLPVSGNGDKAVQEEQIARLIAQTGSDLIVLARYMQILSDDFCSHYLGRMINIHHSFLPGFKGAKPYAQAYERGVKIIGATAHFVTADLDEGPIIAQNIQHINHTYTPSRMQALGRDIEALTLAEAVRLYSERRIFTEQGRTVIL